MQQQVPEYTNSYSTIFQCTQGPFSCFLRSLEGLFSLILFLFLIRGYKNMTAQSNNPISNQDKRIYFLAMAQTLLVTFYYFLFEQFFVLATIRNLLIWISINLLELICKIYWIDNEKNLKIVSIGMKVLMVLNFILWFIIAVSHGSQIKNTSFNLGYNCLTMDWIILSGLLFLICGVLSIVGFLKIDYLDFQIKNQQQKSKSLGKQNDAKNKNLESLNDQKFNIVLICIGSIAGSCIMFIWDFSAYMMAQNDQSCVAIFSGNTIFRNILCFILKVSSMQVVPIIVYYIFYEKKKNQFLYSQYQQHTIQNDIDYLRDDAASQLNRSLTDRIDSRRSLFSSGSTPYL